MKLWVIEINIKGKWKPLVGRHTRNLARDQLALKRLDYPNHGLRLVKYLREE